MKAMLIATVLGLLFLSHGTSVLGEWVADPGLAGDQADASIPKSIAGLITTIGTAPAELRLPAGTYHLHRDYMVPANINLKPDKGAVIKPLRSVRTADHKWTASRSGTFEYYLELAVGGNPSVYQPSSVHANSVALTAGKSGTLAAGHWAWADNDGLGYSTIYVRLADSAGPDSKPAGFVEARYALTFGQGTAQSVHPEWWGRSATDNSAELQAALDSGARQVVLTQEYLVGRHGSSKDTYGVRISRSNVTLLGLPGSKIARKDSVKRTGYPLLFIGVPDSVSAANQISNVVVEGVHFEGSDVRHSSAGSAPIDYRGAIMVRNARDVTIDRNKFTRIDSEAIRLRGGSMWDTAAGDTKSYNIKITRNEFFATAHNVNQRALIHCVIPNGADNVLIDGNYSEWCDNFASGSGTYQDESQRETDRYTYGGMSYRRAGRGWVVTNNRIFNSSEHALYLNGVDITVAANTIWTDNPAVCNGNVKIGGSQKTMITGNNIVSSYAPIELRWLNRNVVISDNSLRALLDNASGVIDINTGGLKAWVDRRASWISGYPLAGDIDIRGGTIQRPAGPEKFGYGIHVIVDASPQEPYRTTNQLENVNISTSISNAKRAFQFYGVYYRNITIRGGRYVGKPFAKTGLDAGTTTNSDAFIGIYGNISNNLAQVSVSGAVIEGFDALMGQNQGAEPSAASLNCPAMLTNKISNVRTPRQSHSTSGPLFAGRNCGP